jgi:CheY-like chemotaxis protein
MDYKINCIMLIDDSKDDNFIHQRVIKRSGLVKTIITKYSALEALQYLEQKHTHQDEHPDLIFLDVNMPGMNGWEFLVEYGELDKELQGKALICMLTTSENPDDKERLMHFNLISEFMTKPLTIEMLQMIINKYFI